MEYWLYEEGQRGALFGLGTCVYRAVGERFFVFQREMEKKS